MHLQVVIFIIISLIVRIRIAAASDNSTQFNNTPTSQPSSFPSSYPSSQPSSYPSSQPSSYPSSQPQLIPTSQPSGFPSRIPSAQPQGLPTTEPSIQPRALPTSQPSCNPSSIPSTSPSTPPTSHPSPLPSLRPTSIPTQAPTFILPFTQVEASSASVPVFFIVFGNILARLLRPNDDPITARLNDIGTITGQIFHVLLVATGWFLYLQSLLRFLLPLLYQYLPHPRSQDREFNYQEYANTEHVSLLAILILTKVPAIISWIWSLIVYYTPQTAYYICFNSPRYELPLKMYQYAPAIAPDRTFCCIKHTTWYAWIIICSFFDTFLLKFLPWKRTMKTDRLIGLPNTNLTRISLFPNAIGSILQSIASLAVFIVGDNSSETNDIIAGLFVVISFVSALLAVFEVLLVVLLSNQLPQRGFATLTPQQIKHLKAVETIDRALSQYSTNPLSKHSVVFDRLSYETNDDDGNDGNKDHNSIITAAAAAAAADERKHNQSKSKDSVTTTYTDDDNTEDDKDEADYDDENDDKPLTTPAHINVNAETIRLLSEVLQDANLPCPHYFKLNVLKLELNALMIAMNEGENIDIGRLDYLLMCLNYHPEYKRELQGEMLKWQNSVRPYLADCYNIMQGFIPPDVFTTRFPLREFLQQSGLPRALAQRIATKRCLWIVRMEIAYLEKLHEAELLGSYNPLGQQLDVVELSAIVHALPSQFKRDPSGKKKKWHESVLDSLKKMLTRKEAGQLTKSQLRHPAYSGLANGSRGPFADRDSLFLPGITAVQQHKLDRSSHSQSMRRAEEGGGMVTLDSHSVDPINGGRSSFMIEGGPPQLSHKENNRQSFRSMSNGNSVKSLIKAMNTRNSVTKSIQQTTQNTVERSVSEEIVMDDVYDKAKRNREEENVGSNDDADTSKDIRSGSEFSAVNPMAPALVTTEIEGQSTKPSALLTLTDDGSKIVNGRPSEMMTR